MNFFDVLKKKLAEKGLAQAEVMAEIAYEAVKETALEVAAASPNNIVRAVVPGAVSVLDGMARNVIDKIDGQPG